MKMLLAALLALAPPAAHAIPSDPGGIDFGSPTCTGIWRLGNYFSVNCTTGEAELYKLKVSSDVTVLGDFNIPALFGTLNPSFVDAPILGNASGADHLRLDPNVSLFGASVGISELDFDPATQAELDAVAAEVAAATTSLQGQLDVFNPNVSVQAPIIGDGSIGDPLGVNPSSVTLQGNTFNLPNKLVQLDGSGRLPAVDGSLLLNVPGVGGGGGGLLAITSHDMTAQVNGVETHFVLPSTPAANTLMVILDGLMQRPNVDYTTINGTHLYMTAPPAADSYSFMARYSTGAVVSANPLIGIGSVADPLRVDPSSVTLQGNSFNGASQLVKLDGTGNLPALNGSNLTGVQASAVRASSQAETVFPINSLTNVHMATATVTTVITRHIHVMAAVTVQNASGGSRDYTIAIWRDGVRISNEYLTTCGNGVYNTVTLFTEESLGPGTYSYSIAVRSTSATATQSATARRLVVDAE